MKFNVLGTEWEILLETLEENKLFEDCDGYCDPSSKTIHVRKYTDKEVESMEFGYANRETMMNKVTRHEIIHAFIFESGLWHSSNDVESWAMNEEMIDWFSIQSPKMFKVFQQLDIL